MRPGSYGNLPRGSAARRGGVFHYRQGMPCRVLIVEDDPMPGRALLFLVRAYGHHAEHVASVAEALEALSRLNPQCVLLDLMLADGSGLAVLEEIRKRSLPVRVAIISSLAAGVPVFDAAIPLQPDGIFQKPWEIDQVLAWISAGEQLPLDPLRNT